MNRSLNEIYGQIFEHLTQKIYWKNKDLKYITCNEAYAQDFGIGIKEITGKKDSSFFPPEVVAVFESDDWQVISSGEKSESEFSFPIKGEDRWVHVVKIPLKDGNGEVNGLCGIVEEVTEQHRTQEKYKQIFIHERKQAEANLKRLNEQLEEKIRDRTKELEAANQELEAFSYSVSHDLRAPLRGLNGFARILLEDYSALLPEDGKHYLRMIPENANKMNILIDDLLSLSRLNRQEMDIHVINMHDLAETVFNELARDQDKTRIEFTLDEIPETHGDLALMRQVWVNLIGNAIKFTSKKKKPKIEVGFFEENKSIIYFVKDNGAGFEVKYAEKMFGVFQRFHGTSEFEGNGVGLAIVRRLLARMNGRIWAKGEVNKGATFFFTVKEQ